MSIKEECFLGRTGVGSVSPASPEREKAVAEITPCYAESRQQDIGPDWIHSGEFHEQNHPRRADQGGTAVDGPAFEVFAQIVAARPEDDPFVAEESVGHGEDLDRLWERFQDAHRNDMRLFYIWGHSYEFDLDHGWERMEAFCEKAGGHDDIWYAANGEIKAYLDALHALTVGARMDMLHNGSALDVWVSVDGSPVRIGAGETWRA